MDITLIIMYYPISQQKILQKGNPLWLLNTNKNAQQQI